jgi:hypothetical protein
VFSQARMSVFSPSLAFVRMTPLTRSPVDVVFFPDGRTLQAFDLRSVDLAGVPLHLISPTGHITRSFGRTADDEQQVYTWEDAYAVDRGLSRAAGGGIWAVRASRYAVERWDTTGVLRQRIVRDVEWFPPWTGQRGSAIAAKPLALCIDEDAAGRLWVLINSKPYVSTIEVLDPRSGQVLASREVEFLTRHIAGGIVATARELPDGTPVLDVYQLQFHQ